MPANPPSLDDEVTFLAGVNAGGVIVTDTFATLVGEGNDATGGSTAAPTYNPTDATPSKFTASGTTSLAGTASGTVTYAFNPDSNYTTTEQSLYLSSMALWSAEANVTFVATAAYGTATLQFTRNATGKAFASTTGGGSAVVRVGTSDIPNNGQAYVSIDSSGTGGFGPLVSVNGGLGYPAGTVVHEIGHTLGLGHGGGYNGSATPSVQQFSQYDTGLYTIMSYIRPEDATAKFYGSYSVTGTNWGGYQGPETPMSLDILAIQRLYGLPVASPLSGGQVFGFNSNITGSLSVYFDFTLNTQPVLTLFDLGGNNTLDLSGYGTASSVNLNAGTYSSANGLVNNIGIAFNTAINTAVGGAGDDTFTLNAGGDTINGGAGANTAVFSGNRADYVLSRANGAVTATKTSNSVVDTLTNIATLRFADATVAADSVACFVHGTLIATPDGEVAVETLRIGDMVLTAAGEARPVRWLGRRSYAGRFFLANPKVRPILFRAGSLGEGLPRRDLRISPEHAMFLGGALVPARALVNGGTIAPDAGCRRVDYVHVELESHDVILAEGAPSETFLDDESRAMFQNAAEYAALYGCAAPGRFCAPRIEDGFALEAIRTVLAASAPSLPAELTAA